MARYRIMYWKEFPAQVKATDGQEVASVMLPDRFSKAIDAAAMAEGSIDSPTYLEGWDWGPEEERSGDARQVADVVASELEVAYPKERLVEMIRTRKRKLSS